MISRTCIILYIQVAVYTYTQVYIVTICLSWVADMINKDTVALFQSFNNSSYLVGISPLVDNSHHIKHGEWLDEFYTEAMKMATSGPYRPKTRVRRDGGYGCKKSGLGIFNFLLFLVVLLGLLNSLLSSAMTMIMINGENVSLLQVQGTLSLRRKLFGAKNQILA